MKRLLSIALAFTLACAARAQFGSTQNNVTLTGTGSNVAANSTLTINATATFADKAIGANQVLYVANATTGNVTGLGIGANLSITGGNITGNTNGTVTSVGLIVPGGLGTSGGPITSSGNITITSALTGFITGNGTGFGTLADPLVVGHGGTGLAAGTSGGVPYFASTSTLASSAALTANNIVIGGGAGAAPFALGAVGTTTTVLHGNASGLPTFATVNLTTDVGNVLPVTNGGTGLATITANNVMVGNGTGAVALIAPGTNGNVLTSNGTAWLSSAAGAGSGNVTGAASSTANDIVTWNGTTGLSIKDASGLTAASGTIARSSGDITITGTSGNIILNPSTGNVNITTATPIITFTGGTSTNAQMITFQPTATNNYGQINILPSGSSTDALFVLHGTSALDTVGDQKFMFGSGSFGAVSGSWSMSSFVNGNTTGTARPISVVVGSSAGRTEIARFTGSSLTVESGAVLIVPTHTPSSASDTGVTGTVTWDASFIYICTGTNAWKRVAIATW